MNKLYKSVSLTWIFNLILLLPMAAIAQETTQFATSVIEFSSEYQYDHANYDADWALGDASDGRRWIPNSYNGQREYLVLGYTTPVEVYNVQIYEDWGAGAVDTIYLRNASTGEWNKVFSTTAAYAGFTRTFSVDINQTFYLVDAIRLAINSPAVGDWNAILAVSITGVPASPNPIVNINTATTSAITNATPIPFTFVFNEPVTGFSLSDIVVTNGTASNFSTLNSSLYAADIYPLQDGLVTVSVGANAVTDQNSNGNLASRIISRYYDITKPMIQITGANPTSGQTIQVRFTTGEAVLGFESGDLIITNGYVNSFYPVDDNGDGLPEYYQAEIIPNETGISDISVDVDSDAFTDLTGNSNIAASQFTTTHYPPQFASSVIGFSSQYQSYYQSDKALNAPDGAFWIPSDQNQQREYIELGFAKPLFVDLVEVYENWRSGAIDTLYLRNAVTQAWTKVFSRTATAGTYQDRLSVSFARTTYPVNGVRIAISSSAIPDWNAIDAVSISGGETPPFLTITSSVSSNTNVSPIPFIFTFSSPVLDFNLSDINVTNGSAGNFVAVSESVYTADVTPSLISGSFTPVTVSVMANAATGISNASGSYPASATRFFRTGGPIINISSNSNPTVENPFIVTFTFDEVPFGFEESDILITNGTSQNFSQIKDNVYSVEVVAPANGTISVNVPAGAVTDEFGYVSAATPEFTIDYVSVTPQYATSVIGFSSQYPNSYYQSNWTLNAPDGRWWIPSDYNGSNREFLELGFPSAILVQRIDIYENWGAGAVDTVYLRNAVSGIWNKVYSGTARYVASSRTFTIRIPQTDYPVDAVRLAINSPAVNDWNAIDAVAIWGLPDPRPLLNITASAPSSFNSPIPFTFTFNQDVTGFDLSDITVTNGIAANVQAISPSVYTAFITPVIHGEVNVSVSENGATNANANTKGNYPKSFISPTGFFFGTRQYASSIISFSSQYSSYWQSDKALNAPDGVFWIPSNEDAAREFLELGFSTPQYVSRIEVYENWQSGAIDTVYVRNAATGKWIKVYKTTASPHEYARTLTISIPVTSYLVDAIRLAINSPAVENWNAIDAVSISDIYRLNQSITFNPLANKVYGNAPFALTAVGDSGNPATYTSSDVSVATVSGNMVTILAAGTTTITAKVAASNDYAAPYLATAAAPQSLTIDKASQLITFAPLAAKKFGDPSFTLTATGGGSALPLTYVSSNTSVATINDNKVTIVGVGSTTITASQAGNANYSAAPDVGQTLTVNKGDQTIAFAALRDRASGEPAFTISATGGASGNAVTFSSSNTAVATVSGNTITLVGVGTTNITASQTGNANYNAATNVIQPLVVNTKTSQTITFSAIPTKTFGNAPFTISATGGASGLPVTFASSNTSVATVSGNTVTIISAGTTTITASQAGNTTFNAADNVPQTLTVNQLSQTISFAGLTTKTFGDAAFTLSATGGATGLPVTFTSSNTSVATITGSTVTIVGAGSTTIIASQAGNTNYSAATDVPQTFTVNKADQTITFNALSEKAVGNGFTLTATASSGLPVSYTSSNAAVVSITGNTCNPLALGTAAITALQAGNSNFNPATNVEQSITVKNGQTITFDFLSDKTFGDAPFALNGSASSGLTLTYTSSNTNVATISGSTVTIVGAGVSNITAAQGGNSTYAAASITTQSLTVKKGNQTITFPAIADKTVGDAPFSSGATASSGLPVSLTSGSNKISISGNQITLVAAGRVSVLANQPGNGNYSEATSASRSFCIKPAKPTVSITGDETSAVTLASSATAGNQWFKNGSAISGATNTSLTVKDPGVYKVQVTVDDCISDFSSDAALIITGDLRQQISGISIYPNPVENYLEVSGLKSEVVNATVYDMIGHAVTLTLKKEGKTHRANIQQMTSGAYVIKIIDETTVHQLKFIKN